MTPIIQASTSSSTSSFLPAIYYRWRGYIIQRWTTLSIEMHGNPIKALAIILISNALFYAIISRKILQTLDARLSNVHGIRFSRSVHFFVLFPLTVMFNISVAKLTNYQLSRTTLIILSCAALIFRSLSIRWEYPCN